MCYKKCKGGCLKRAPLANTHSHKLKFVTYSSNLIENYFKYLVNELLFTFYGYDKNGYLINN